MYKLSDSESRDIEEDLTKALEKAQKQLERLKNRPNISSGQYWFQLEYSVVSPLYYRLEKHLLDWASDEHPVQRTDYGQYRIKNNLKFNDIPPLKLYRDDLLHQLSSSEDGGGEASRDPSGTV